MYSPKQPYRQSRLWDKYITQPRDHRPGCETRMYTLFHGQYINPLICLLQNSIMGSSEVGMVIGLLQCQQDPCPPPNAQLGSIVFNGQFSPQLHSDKPGEPYQNFTITVPAFLSNFGTTKAQLATAHFHLIGVMFRIYFFNCCVDRR